MGQGARGCKRVCCKEAGVRGCKRVAHRPGDRLLRVDRHLKGCNGLEESRWHMCMCMCTHCACA